MACKEEMHVCWRFDIIRPDIGQKNSKTIWNLLFIAVKKLKKTLSHISLIQIITLNFTWK